MTPLDKQQWLGPLSNLKDYSNILKGVTFRSTDKSILSNWSDLVIDPIVWTAIQKEKNNNFKDKEILNPIDHWDSIILKTNKLNNKRTDDGLLNLHWLRVSELAHCENI